jgi:ubiquinone biosynthesis protein UbiJ
MVHVDQVETMNLLGLIVRGLLVENLRDPQKARRLYGLRGDVLIRADRMQVTLRIRDGDIHIVRGEPGPADAHVEGTLGGLLHVALGRGLFAHALRGEVAAGGRVGLILRLLPLLRVADGR